MESSLRNCHGQLGKTKTETADEYIDEEKTLERKQDLHSAFQFQSIVSESHKPYQIRCLRERARWICSDMALTNETTSIKQTLKENGLFRKNRQERLKRKAHKCTDHHRIEECVE